jgi:hypothetical protein
MKKDLEERIKDVDDPKGELAANLKRAKDDVGALATWAIKSRSYWAFELLFHLEQYWLPMLQAKMKTGSLSQKVAMDIKVKGAVFGVLEAGSVNPAGPNFSMAFNNMVRAFSLTNYLAQFVDTSGNASDFSEITNGILQEFLNAYVNGSGDGIHQALADTQSLLANQWVIEKLIKNLRETNANAATFTSWDLVVKNMYTKAESQGWYKKLSGAAGMLGIFLRVSAVAMSIMALLSGRGWSVMTTSQKMSVIATGVGLFAAVTVKIAQGQTRSIFSQLSV